MSERPLRPTYKRWDTFNILLAGSVGLFVLFMVSPFLDAILGTGGRDNARRSSCQSNMKQLSLAIQQYTQDNDGDLPPIRQASGQKTWRELIYPFVQSTAVYRCPDNHNEVAKDTPQTLPYSYGVNISSWYGNPTTNASITLVDMDGYAGPEWNITDPMFLPKTGRELHAHIPKHRFYEHPSGTINILFADGHVKFIKPLVTLTPVNLWTRDNAPFTGQELQNAQAILKHAENE